MNYALGFPPISACPRRGAACRTQAQKDCAYPSMVCSIVGSGRTPQTAEHAAPAAGRRRSVRKGPGVRLEQGVGRRGRRDWAPSPPPERFRCSEGSVCPARPGRGGRPHAVRNADRTGSAPTTGRPNVDPGRAEPGTLPSRCRNQAASTCGRSTGRQDGRGPSDRPGPRDARGRPAARVTAAGAGRARGPLAHARPGRKAAAPGGARVRGPGNTAPGPTGSGARARGGGRRP